jgi:hypothetical protein
MNCASGITDARANKLARERERLVGKLLDRATITRPGSPSGDGFGGFTEAGPSTVATDVPCSYKSTSGREVNIADSIRALGQYVITFPFNTDIGEKDTVTVAARDAELEKVFAVSAVLHSSDAISLQVLATKG